MPELLGFVLLVVAGGTALVCALIFLKGVRGERRRARSNAAPAQPIPTRPPASPTLSAESPRPTPPPATVVPRWTGGAVPPPTPKPTPPPDSHWGVTMDDVDAYLRGDPEQDSFKKGQINAMMEDLDRWQRERQQPKKQGKN